MNIQEIKEKAELFASDVQVQVKSFTEDISNIPTFLKKNIESAPATFEKVKTEFEVAASKVKEGTFFDDDVKKDLQKKVSTVETTIQQWLDAAKNAIQQAK